MASVAWDAVPAVKNLLTTELNSLAAGTLTALGPEINNIGGPQEGQLTVKLASAAFIAGNFIAILFMPSDDTNGNAYGTLGTFANEALANYLADVIFIKGSTGAQQSTKQFVRVPSGKFKAFAYTGGTPPALASSGNTVDLYLTPTKIS